MAADSFWIAALNTRHFEFWAFGETKAEALRIFRLNWNQHRRRTGAQDTWKDIEDGVFVGECHIGGGYTDKEQTYRRPEHPKGSMSWMEAERKMKAMNKAARTGSPFKSGNVREMTKILADMHKKGEVIKPWRWKTLVRACPIEPVRCAAVYYKGFVYEGWSHAWIGQKMVYDKICPRPFPGGPAQGFTLFRGLFVSREQALVVALANGQVERGKHQHPTQLFSEDLRYDKK